MSIQSLKNHVSKLPLFVPSEFTLKLANIYPIAFLNNCIEKERTYQLSFIQKVFVTFHHANSSILSNVVAFSVAFCTLLSILLAVLSSEEHFQYIPTTCSNPILFQGEEFCPPQSTKFVGICDSICLIIFVVDYIFRVSTVIFVNPRLAEVTPADWDVQNHKKFEYNLANKLDDPDYSKLQLLLRYIFSLSCIIDVLAVLPYFLTNQNYSFLKILRLLRFFRIICKYSISTPDFEMLMNAITASLKPGFFLLLYLALYTLLAGMLMNLLEGGVYTINDEYPNGAYIRENDFGEFSVSPFTSIFSSLYWAAVTITTVGYGDLYPVTKKGRVLATLTAFLGVFFLALPVNLLGNNYMLEGEKVKKRRNTIKLMKHDSFHENIDSKLQSVKKKYTNVQNEIILPEINVNHNEIELVKIAENSSSAINKKNTTKNDNDISISFAAADDDDNANNNSQMNNVSIIDNDLKKELEELREKYVILHKNFMNLENQSKSYLNDLQNIISKIP